MDKTKFYWFNERNIFYSVLFLNLFWISISKFYPSVDGAAHLYNSNLIWHIIRNNSGTLPIFFVLNSFPMPNWISHFILALFNFILPAWLAEKFFLYMYLIGLTISFRLLIRQLNPSSTLLSVLIFPFAYSSLFHVGLYNYIFSFIFLFYTLYYWIKTRGENTFKKYFGLFILFLLIYFSGVLTIIFTAICLFFFVLVFSISDFARYGRKIILIAISKRILFIFIASLPGLILFIIFYFSTSFGAIEHSLHKTELIKRLLDVSPLIFYRYENEKGIAQQFLYLFVFIILLSIFLRIKNRAANGGLLNKNDIVLFPVASALILLFIIPDNSSAGMMSDRFILMFYMLLIIWISSQKIFKNLIPIVALYVITLHACLLLQYREPQQKLKRDANLIYNASQYILPNSVVLPVYMDNNWLEIHFSNYLGAEKPLVILENYEANIGWFPIKWNVRQMPQVMLGGKSEIADLNWITNKNSPIIRKIDYVFLFGDPSSIDKPNWRELKQILLSEYKEIYISENKKIALFKIKSTG